jgi:hypothetical protein
VTKLKALASRLWRPTMPFALALLVVCGLGIYWGRHDSLRAWGPNIAVGAFGLAATITVVELVVRREACARLRPRTDAALWRVGLSFRFFTGAVITDYLGTHSPASKRYPTTRERANGHACCTTRAPSGCAPTSTDLRAARCSSVAFAGRQRLVAAPLPFCATRHAGVVACVAAEGVLLVVALMRT